MPQPISTDECPTPAVLAEFQQGLLSDEDSERIERHLANCTQCETTLNIVDAKVGTVITPRSKVPADPHESEKSLQSALAAAEKVGREPSPKTLAQAEKVTPAAEPALRELGQYKLLKKLGQGGMGAVYKALHTRLDRVVALKLLPPGALDDDSALARFEREMRAVGKLQHPNIVAAHDAGDVDGTHYLVMELVEGGDLADVSKLHGPLPAGAACELVRQAALGLQHAHEHGMVHRDIKPSNLMLSRDGTVKVLDMGLALLAEHVPAGGELTGTGQLMGTLDYMAPEQGMDTHGVDIRADVYSLGATLYKLLAGRAPFGGESFTTPIRKLQALALKEPDRIETLRPDLPVGLAEVVHRMLAKEPGDRYATPAEVAAALASYAEPDVTGYILGDEPLSAAAFDEEGKTIPYGDAGTTPALEKTVLGASQSVAATPSSGASSRGSSRDVGGRKPPWTLIGGLAGAALVAAIVFFLPTKEGTIRVEITDPDIKVEVTAKGVVLTEKDADPVTVEPGDHTLKITRGDFQFTTDAFRVTKGEDVVVKVELLDGEITVATRDGRGLGARPLESRGDPDVAVADNPTPEPLPGDPVSKPSDSNPKPIPGDEAPKRPWWPVATVDVPPLAKTSVFDTLSRDDIDPAELAAAETREPMPDLVAILGDSRFAHDRQISHLDIDPSTGELLTTTANRITSWSLETGRQTGQIDGPQGIYAGSDPRVIVFSERGNRLVVAEGPKAARRFTLDIGKPWTSIAMQPDGKSVLLGFKDGSLGAWSTETGQPLFETEPAPEGTKGADVNAIAFAPSGEWFVVASSGTNVSIRSSTSGEELRSLNSPASAMTVSSDGARIAIARGKNASVWNAETAEEVFMTPETAPILRLALSPDGKVLVTVSPDTMIVWDAVEGTLLRRIGARHLNGTIAFTPDSQRIVAGMSEIDGSTQYGYSTLGIWDVETGEDTLRRRGPAGPVTDVHVSGDGRVTAVAMDNSLTSWSTETRELLRQTRPAVGNVVTGEFNADGSSVLLGRSGRFTVWDVARDLEVTTYNGHYFNPARLVIHGDGSIVAAMGGFGMRSVVDVDAKQERFKFKGNEAAFTPDGSTLAVAGGAVFGQDVATGEEFLPLPESGGVKRLLFSPDGKLLVTSHTNGKLVVRETRAMTRTRELSGSGGVAVDIAFSRDARFIAIVSTNAVTVWDLEEKSSQPLETFALGTPFTQATWQHIENNVALEFTPEGRHVVLGRRNGTVQVFRFGSGN